MQFAEGLSDVHATEVVRGRIDWKYALGLALTDSGFDASVLSEFRTRLLAGGAQLRLLEGMLARFRGLGLLKAGGRARTGSHSSRKPSGTRSINWLWPIPQWLRAQITPEWFEHYGRHVEEYRMRKGKAEREALAGTIGTPPGRYRR